MFSLLVGALIALIISKSRAVIYFDTYNVIENTDSWSAASQNAAELMRAVADASSTNDDREVVIASGKVYYMVNMSFVSLQDITLRVDGIIRFSDEINNYANTSNEYSLLYFSDCQGLRFTGSGSFDGQGMKWWRLVSYFRWILYVSSFTLVNCRHIQVLITGQF